MIKNKIESTEQSEMEKEETLFTDPLTGLLRTLPKKITRIRREQVVTETGELFPIGLTHYHNRLNVQALGYDISRQEELGQVTAKVARFINLLPHLQYKQSKHGANNAHGTLPPDFFIYHGHYQFTSKPEVTPAQALNAIFVNPGHSWITECSIVIQMMFYKAILDFVGDDKFNQFFASRGLMFQSKMYNHPLTPFRTSISTAWNDIVEDSEPMFSKVQPGDLLYISNIRLYQLKHPVGDSPGSNVIYLGKNEKGQPELAGLFTNKWTPHYDEVIDLLVEDYNKLPFATENT